MFARMFQALANGSQFSVDWMKPLDKFLIKYRPAYEKYCADIVARFRFCCVSTYTAHYRA